MRRARCERVQRAARGCTRAGKRTPDAPSSELRAGPPSPRSAIALVRPVQLSDAKKTLRLRAGSSPKRERAVDVARPDRGRARIPAVELWLPDLSPTRRWSYLGSVDS
jgi:hypothetical protein